MASLVNPMLEALPKVEQLSSRVVRVLGLNPGRYTLQGTNTYLVGTGEKRILVDTAEPGRKDYIELLRETLASLKACVSTILLTHWHHDHTGGVEGVTGLYPDSAIPVCKLPRAPPPTPPPTPPPSALWDPLASLSSEDLHLMREGEVVRVDGATLRVVATPGHTDDHMALYLEEENAVFTGDCILGQGSAVFEDLHSYMQSLSKLQSLQPSLLYPGHGPVILKGSDKIRQYIQHRNEREKQVIAALEHSNGPVTAMTLVEAIYKDVDKSLWSGAKSNVTHHLHKLLKDGRVAKQDDGTGTVTWVLSHTHPQNT